MSASDEADLVTSFGDITSIIARAKSVSKEVYTFANDSGVHVDSPMMASISSWTKPTWCPLPSNNPIRQYTSPPHALRRRWSSRRPPGIPQSSETYKTPMTLWTYAVALPRCPSSQVIMFRCRRYPFSDIYTLLKPKNWLGKTLGVP